MIPRSASCGLAVLLPPMLALSACGGVSKEDYAQQLDQVCSDIEERTEEIGAPRPESPAELSSRLDALREAIRGGIDRMKDIERPEGEDGETAERYVEALERTLNEQFLPALEDLEQAVRSRDRPKIRAAARRLQSIDESETQQLAEELGADECAEG